MNPQGSSPGLPDGVDEQEYERIRNLMRGSVLFVWGKRGREEVVAGRDPWDVVDEAWASMAASGFSCQGPFAQHACAVARNKAIDVVRRLEARKIGPSLDAPVGEDEGDGTYGDSIEDGSGRAEDQYLAAQRLILIEDAVFNGLDPREQDIFFGVRVERKSRAAVGRELDPPISGQRVGEILAALVIKVRRSLEEHGDILDLGA